MNFSLASTQFDSFTRRAGALSCWIDQIVLNPFTWCKVDISQKVNNR